MPFATRNVYHLRLSAHSVLPLYVYLDNAHVDWMTNTTLLKVLTELRPLILPKLQAEGLSSSKKGTVEVIRGDDYQFAFFVRKVDSQSNVLIKTRRFTPSKAAARKADSPTPVALGKRKRANRPLKEEPGLEQNDQSTRSDQQRAHDKGNEVEEITDGSDDAQDDPDYLQEEEPEEEKPKMNMHLSYQGFSMFGRCLCIVVEPWPPLNSTSEKTSKQPQQESAPNLQQAPRLPSEAPYLRGETPLFLPDPDPPVVTPSKNRVPLSGDDVLVPPAESKARLEEENDKENSGMMALTQLLQTSVMYRIDSDSDGEEAGVFMGDPEASRDIF